MKRTLIICHFIIFSISFYGQKTISAPVFTEKSDISKPYNLKDQLEINDILWTSDFSVSSNWVISNTTNDNQNWIITTSAPQGTYSAPLGIIGSTTAANGFALFDSDFLGVNGGYQNASIATASSINLTNKINVSVTFQQKYRRYQIDQTFIGISVNGTTWTDFEVNASLPDGQTTTSPVTVDVSSVADNHSQVWLRFHYIGEWDYAWMVDDVQITGNDNPNPPAIVSVNPNEAHQNQTLTVTLSGQNTHFSQGNQTIWFNQGSSTIFYGTSNNASNNVLVSTYLELPYNAPTGYYDVHIQNATDGSLSYLNGFLVNIWAPDWNYNTAGNTHSIVIPNYADITIDGVPVEPGDYIGVFYDQSGIPACGGFVQWTGITTSLTAYGASGGDNGFNTGETFVWKVWDASANTVYHATATYITSGFPNTNTFAPGGISAISGLAAITVDVQNINIVQGWSIISTYINPSNPSIINVLSPLTNLVICKNGNGQVYWPTYSINQIGNIVIGEGYQINCSASGLLPVQGTAVVPENTPLNLPGTWSIMGYLRQTPGLIETILSPIVSNVMIVKDWSGLVYWPVWGVNGIVNMIPGQGYQIRVTAATVFTYPPNNISSTKNQPVEKANFNKGIKNTGANMTLGIPASCFLDQIGTELITPGDEIEIFTKDGILVGAGIYNGENIAVIIWGNDELTPLKDGLLNGEEFFIKIMNISSKRLLNIEITDWLEGNNYYETNGISVAGSLKIMNGFCLYQNIPNPVNDRTEISFYIPENSQVSILVNNILGEKIFESANRYFVTGVYSLTINTTSFPEGQYFYTLTTPVFSETRKFIIIR
jgi:hypothetical protein